MSLGPRSAGSRLRSRLSRLSSYLSSSLPSRDPLPLRLPAHLPGLQRARLPLPVLPERFGPVRLLLAVTAVLLMVGAAWITVTGFFARSELLAAKGDLQALRHSVTGAGTAFDHESGSASAAAGASDGGADAWRTMGSAASHASLAHRLTTGPAWYLASRIPLIGRPFESVRGATHAADRLTHEVFPALVRVVPAIARDTRGRGFQALLSALRDNARGIDRAAGAAAATEAEVAELPRDTWLPAADLLRDELAAGLDGITSAMSDASVAARVLPPMLGDEGPRRFFVVFQNTAEARGTGGIPAAFALVTADRGRLSFGTFGNESSLATARPLVDLGAEFTSRYGPSNPTSTWANTNLSPHFPYAARIWAEAWRAHSGKHVDGVIALDPSALSLLLRAAGPARLSDGTALTADNLRDLAERTGYGRFADPAKRKTVFFDAVHRASLRLGGAIDDPRRLPAVLDAVHHALRQDRMKVWSTWEDEQRLLETRPLGGVLPSGEGPFAGLVVNNTTGGKLDYYLDRRLEWTPGRCTPEGRPVIVRISLTNHAPVSGLPGAVTLRADKPSYPTRPGDNRLLVSYYASAGAELTGAALDGTPVATGTEIEHGHPVYTTDLELPAQQTRTLTLTLMEPLAERAPRVLSQPLVNPLQTIIQPYPLCAA
ncbi:DUF4012 domain-containing protein [Streptomyces sp. NPDC127084]|uniref:DUF4012 domain-containing protein n=1 Tax=Streptomyces sp. NPDC127084 TaxID=3347133 RepID=UPI003665A69D